MVLHSNADSLVLKTTIPLHGFTLIGKLTYNHEQNKCNNLQNFTIVNHIHRTAE
jgi:hypothetical protein